MYLLFEIISQVLQYSIYNDTMKTHEIDIIYLCKHEIL